MYKSVPTYYNQTETWGETIFDTKEEFTVFIESLFKEPGQYQFDKDTLIFNAEATRFLKEKVYCKSPFKSKDFIAYWNDQKNKCRNGIIIVSANRKKKWYLPREYYMWLNFLQIYDKEKKKFAFPGVRDVQYHIALYELLAELKNKHVAILKKRQIASSYYHAAKIINYYWFEEGFISKMAASLKDYINEKGTWRFLEEYRNFLNTHTAWYRPSNPDKILNWEQKIEIRKGGKKVDKGLKSIILGYVLEKDPANGVGGPCLDPDTEVLMSDYTLKKVKNITINDEVIGYDGLPKKVQRLFSGESQMYEVVQSNGMSYITTKDHILYLYDIENKKHVKIQTKDFNSLSKWKREKVLKGVKYDGYEGKHIDFFIEPYYLGLYLGDGCKSDFSILINKDKDIEIYNYLLELSKIKNFFFTEKKRKNRNYNVEMVEIRLTRSCRRGYKLEESKQTYVKEFSKLGLNKKHIPEKYFNSSKNQRLELLAGILDTDGYYSKDKNRFELHVKSESLKDDIIRLCLSVGLDCKYYNIKESNVTSTVVNTETQGYRLRITGYITKIPCKLPRKQAKKNGIKNKNRFSTIKVKPLNVGSYNGFQCEDNLFILKDGTVSHNCGFFFHEEAGIAPKMSETIEYLLPSLKSGMVYTGQFAVAGSVGSLDQCDPLKNMILYPNSVDILPVKTNLLNESGEERECGLFIPEQWSMPPYVDEYGNSQVEEALKAIIEERKSWREELNEKEYQLRISQKPTNIEEAFAIRGEPEFSTHLVNKQLRRIKEGLVPCRYVDLKRDSGKILCVPSKKRPIDTFPIKPGSTDKEGVIVIYEDPVENPSFGLYLASIDPVSEGRTTTSNSLCSIYIYKTPSEVYSVDENGAPTSTIEEGKIVASWCGRFDDLNKTHERLETLIEYYNAWTLIENNISLFIQYMFLKKKQRYLVPKSQVLFLKSLQANQNVYQEYGWKNVSTLFSNHLISYASAFVDEVIDTVTTSNGDIVKEIHGVERIPDPMLLQEMLAYKKGLNVDRLVAFSALVAFASVQVSNRGYVKRKEGDSKNLSNNQKNSNLKVSPFVNLGKKMYTDHSRIKKSPFKNIHR